MSEQVDQHITPSARPSMVRQTGQFLADFFRIVIFQPVRYGTLALGPHSAGIAGITWAVTVIYAITVGSILLANPLRSISPLRAQIDATSNLVVPVFLVPAVLCVLGVSFGLLLAGSQRAPWWRRILYLLVVGAILCSVAAISAGLGSGGLLAWATVVLLGVALAYVIAMWLVRTRPAIDAIVLVALSCLILLASYRSLMTQSLLGEEGEQTITTAAVILQQVATLALPVAFLSGINATALGVSIVSWGGEEVGRRAAMWLSLAIAGVVLLLQWLSVVRGAIMESTALADRATQILAAGVLVAVCALVWWWSQRGDPVRDVSPVRVSGGAVAVAVPLAYGVTAAAFIGALLGAIVIALQLVAPEEVVSPFVWLLDLAGTQGFATALRIAVVVGLLVAAVLLVRRGSRLMGGIAAVYAVVLGSYYFILLPSRWLWTPSSIGDIGLIAATVLAAVWTVQRSWHRGRAGFVLTLALLSALVRQADFFAVPLGFVIGASATALLIVGLVWGFLTDGGEAHENSPRFPGDRQLLVLLGTFLFGAAIVSWAVLGKVVATSLLLSEVSALALQTLGSALIIVIVLEAYTLTRRPIQSPDDHRRRDP